MAAPTVRGTSTPTLSTDGVPAFSVTLPTRVAGDLLLAFCSSDAVTTAISRSETTTWAVLYEESSGVTTRHACFARIATNDANDALTVGMTNAQDGVVCILVITTGTHAGGVGGVNVIESAQATGSSATADPPNVDGGYVNDWLAVAHASLAMTATTDVFSAAPTNYTTGAVLTKSASSTTSVGFGLGYRALTAAQTENPGAFANTSRAWQTKTLLVPAPLSASGNAVTATVTYAATNAVGSPTVFANPVAATVTSDATNPTTEAWFTFAHGASTATSITVTGLTNTVSYDFRVGAVNSVGLGPWSNVANATPSSAGDASATSVTATVTASAANPGIGQSPPAVTATVTVAATNAVGKGTANPPSVTATVTADAANAAGQVAGNATATAVTANVTYAATNPTTKLSSNPPSVTATVTYAATNPTVTRLSNAAAVTATVTYAAANPTTKLSANPPAVTATVTYAATNPTALVTGAVLYPVTVSGRKWLDQNGDPYLLKCMSSWALAENSASNADITTALEQAASRGFNSVQVALFGITQEPDWHPYTNHAGDPVFTGTPFASSLGSAWLTFDWVMDEATRLGITVVVSLFYGFGSIGCRADMNTAYTASPTNVYNFGHDVATRYASYPNIVWSLEADAEWFYTTAPWGAQTDKYFEGIKAGEGATPRLIISEPNLGNTAYFQWESSFTHTGGFSYFWLDANSVYQYGNAVVDQVDAVMNETGATTYPVWDSEIPYVSNGFPGSANRQQLRERVYASFIRGVIGMNYGSEDWWPFGYDSWTSGSYTWDTFMAGNEALDAGRAWTLIDAYVADVTWAPSAFITGGVGTGDTKAAGGNSNTVALAYFPNSRGSITVDTTLLAGTGNVRLRWYDPTNGAYTSIAASEAQNASRSVTHPGNNSAGDGDQVLVVDVLAVDASANAVTATVTVDGTNATVKVSSAASSVTATVTVSATNPTVTRLSNAAAVTATVTASATNPTETVLSNANAVTATVTVAATNAAGQGTANASSVTATVTVAASNATGQTTAAGTANSVAALVTVDATNPTVKVSSASSAVTATVVVAATNPTVTRLSNGNAVTASAAADAFNPTTKLTANPPSVVALVTAIANNAVGQVNAAGSANSVTATVVVAATNPTVTRLSNAGPVFAALTAGATNPTTKLSGAAAAVYALVTVVASNASSVRLGLRGKTTSVRITSPTVAARLVTVTPTEGITSPTATEVIE